MLRLFASRWQRASWFAVGWALVATVFVLSLISLSPQVAPKLGWDKVVHALAYATLSGWFVWPKPARAVAITLAFVAMGGSLELIQGQLPHRAMEWGDLIANGVGALLGTSIALLFDRAAYRWPPAPVS